MGKKSDGKTLSLGASILSLEPALVLHMTSAISVFMVVQDYMLERACRVNLKYSESICSSLEDRYAGIHGKICFILMMSILIYLHSILY